MVITITFGAAFVRDEMALTAMLVLIGSSYLFKMTVALVDTVPFYIGVYYLGRYLRLEPGVEHHADLEESGMSGRE